MVKEIGLGIIGCGTAARWHADSAGMTEGARLAGVCDSSFERAAEFAEKYGCLAFSSAEELVASKDVDIVSICVPSGLHAKFAVMAANAGKHIIVEKPLALTNEQIDAVTEACERNGVMGTVISQLRFTPAVMAVKRAIDEGRLGRLILGDMKMKYYRSPEYYKSADWRGRRDMDGGAMMNQGIHGIDLLLHLMGPMTSVSGVCKTIVHDIESEDTACFSVEFENGAVGSITAATTVSPGYPRIIEISGTKGTVALSEDKLVRWDIEGEEMPELCDILGSNNGFKEASSFSEALHAMQIKDFFEAVRDGGRPYIDINDGAMAVKMILGAYEASERGCKIIL